MTIFQNARPQPETGFRIFWVNFRFQEMLMYRLKDQDKVVKARSQNFSFPGQNFTDTWCVTYFSYDSGGSKRFCQAVTEKKFQLEKKTTKKNPRKKLVI
jgi:hypothetical protein